MEFTLLDNGQDSLRKAKFNIEKYEELIRGHGYPYAKDAIIFLNHGIEILLKYILSQRNEYLIYSDLKLYISAKKDLKKQKSKKLHTVTLTEALERLEFLCEIEIPLGFRSSIDKLSTYRNDLTHHSFSLTIGEEEKLLKMLKALFNNVIEFFEKHISGTMDTINAIRFEMTHADWEEMQQVIKESYEQEILEEEYVREQEANIKNGYGY